MTPQQHIEVLTQAFRGLAGEYTWQPDDVRLYPKPGAMGRCVCGHPIRAGYIWRHPDGHAVEVGSDCTQQVPGLDEQFASLVVADALERAKVEQAAARRLKREEREEQQRLEAMRLEMVVVQSLDALHERLDSRPGRDSGWSYVGAEQARKAKQRLARAQAHVRLADKIRCLHQTMTIIHTISA